MKGWEGRGRPRRWPASRASPDYHQIRPTEGNFLTGTWPFFERASFPRESKLALLVVQAPGRREGAACGRGRRRARGAGAGRCPGRQGSRAQGHRRTWINGGWDGGAAGREPTLARVGSRLPWTGRRGPRDLRPPPRVRLYSPSSSYCNAVLGSAGCWLRSVYVETCRLHLDLPSAFFLPFLENHCY